MYGARAASRPLARTYLALVVALAPSLALLALADGLATMLVLAALSGCVIAPLTAAENELAGVVAPAGTLTEAYGWVITAVVVGVAAGSAAGGALVEAAGWRAAVLAPCVLVLAGAAVAFARRRTLVAPAVAGAA